MDMACSKSAQTENNEQIYPVRDRSGSIIGYLNEAQIQATIKRAKLLDRCDPKRERADVASFNDLTTPDEDATADDDYHRWIDWSWQGFCQGFPVAAELIPDFDRRAAQARSDIQDQQSVIAARGDLLGLMAETRREKKHAQKMAEKRRKLTKSTGLGKGTVVVTISDPYTKRFEEQRAFVGDTVAKLVSRNVFDNADVLAILTYADFHRLLMASSGSIDYAQDRVDVSRRNGGVSEEAAHAARLLERVERELGRFHYDMLTEILVKGSTLDDVARYVDKHSRSVGKNGKPSETSRRFALYNFKGAVKALTAFLNGYNDLS